jgi:O-antigen/teichoic acid export membrane protein
VVKVGIGIVALTIAAQAVLATTNAYFQANHKYNYSFFANLVAAIANTLLIIYLANQKLNLLIVISAYTVAGIIGACTALVLVRKQVKSVSPIFDKKYWKELLKETLPLTISLVLNLIYFRIDGLILPIYRGLIEIGQYNVAYKMFDAILVIPNYFANALYPILLEKRTESINAFTSTIKKSAAILALIAVIGSILTILLAPFAIKVLLNEDSTQTAQYLRILSSGLLFFFLSSISMWALIVIGKQKLLSYIYGTTMILNLVLNILLIPLYGATASAYITITTEALVLLLSGSLLIYNLQRIKNK